MPGIVKIWWHDGATKDVRYNDLPVVNEPELGFEQLVVGSSPITTGTAPTEATVAIVESEVNLRYRVRLPGTSDDASDTESKPLPATGFATDSIGVAPGCSISFVEA
ncbi:MAG: hypothetical protein AAF713_12015 [Pseudomonadota bacterium]